ncbi:hypothetical protein [Halorhabdus tiamatea]|uniref:hypothetical protein n=1 Tax=Halorhabdus tiamatea TaxID=430914 RepID=UPI001FCAA091|nr:hypothetical protein [Halorhabdus tiamatea]
MNPPTDDDKDGVPIEWVGHLAHHTDHIVYATGNQTLKDEAKIPGIGEIVKAYPGTDQDGEDVDLSSRPKRRERVDMLKAIYPDADRFVVVDDIDLSDMEGWDHFYPWDFVSTVESSEIDCLPPSDDDISKLGSTLDPQPHKGMFA